MVDFCFKNIYRDYEHFFIGPKIDLSKVTFVDPWGLAILCLSIAKYNNETGFEIVLPKDNNVLHYLKRAHLDEYLADIGLIKHAILFEPVKVKERDNLNILEISYCQTKDIFGARLDKFYQMFKHCGLDDSQSGYLTGILGEIGNNSFDHNLGNWPLDLTGAIIVGQAYPKKKQLEIVVADPGIGFKDSLRRIKPDLKNQVEAIKIALKEGISGRIDERRGNGLKIIQDWTFNQLSGKLMVQSYDGLIEARSTGIKSHTVFSVSGTIVGVKISY